MGWQSIAFTAAACGAAAAALLLLYAALHRGPRLRIIYHRGLNTALQPLTHGLDAMEMIRFVGLLSRLTFWWSVIGCGILVPLYALASGSEGAPAVPNFEHFTLLNVPAGGGEFWAASAAAWLQFGVAVAVRARARAPRVVVQRLRAHRRVSSPRCRPARARTRACAAAPAPPSLTSFSLSRASTLATARTGWRTCRTRRRSTRTRS